MKATLMIDLGLLTDHLENGANNCRAANMNQNRFTTRHQCAEHRTTKYSLILAELAAN
jgi:hypothetical protein